MRDNTYFSRVTFHRFITFICRESSMYLSPQTGIRLMGPLVISVPYRGVIVESCLSRTKNPIHHYRPRHRAVHPSLSKRKENFPLRSFWRDYFTNREKKQWNTDIAESKKIRETATWASSQRNYHGKEKN